MHSFALLTTHCNGLSSHHLEMRIWPEKGLGRQVCSGSIPFTAEPQQPLRRVGSEGAVCHSHLLEPKQNENLSHPKRVSSSALGTAQQATTELVQNARVDTALHSHLLCQTYVPFPSKNTIYQVNSHGCLSLLRSAMQPHSSLFRESSVIPAHRNCSPCLH